MKYHHFLFSLIFYIFSHSTFAEELPDNFNKYIVDAVKELYQKYPSMGYSKNQFYTHNIDYDGETVKASQAPLTMCVAATAEVIITALNLYVKKTGDKSVYTYFPAAGWNRMRPKDIRSHIWVDPRLNSSGTADALVTFGVGKKVKFSELEPGSFINFNRLNGTGHSAIFLGFIDGKGEILPHFSDQVMGFKYFSAQGTGTTGDAGFAYRYAFFAKDANNPYCPGLPAGKRRDCGIIWSANQKLLNTGYMLWRNKWDAGTRDNNLKKVVERLYAQTYNREISALPGIPNSLSKKEFLKAIDIKDTMVLNPIFASSNATTDE